jgi:hypothetical protein
VANERVGKKVCNKHVWWIGATFYDHDHQHIRSIISTLVAFRLLFQLRRITLTRSLCRPVMGKGRLKWKIRTLQSYSRFASALTCIECSLISIVLTSQSDDLFPLSSRRKNKGWTKHTGWFCIPPIPKFKLRSDFKNPYSINLVLRFFFASSSLSVFFFNQH